MTIQTCTHRAAIYLASALLLLGGCSKKPHLTSSASIVIEPGVSFGSISKGMTRQQIIDILGEPDESDEKNLKYFNLGFFVNLKNNVVHTISCLNAGKQNGPIKQSFAGHTKEGIGLGSSKEDILRAYGAPTTIESNPKAPGIEVLRYQPLGLFFMLQEEKVLNMSVIF